MDEATKQAALSILRTVLIALGTWLVSRGYFTETALNDIVGGVMVVAPLIWGAWNKFTSERKTQAREVVAVNVGILKADNTEGITPLETPASAPTTIARIAPAVPKQA